MRPAQIKVQPRPHKSIMNCSLYAVMSLPYANLLTIQTDDKIARPFSLVYCGIICTGYVFELMICSIYCLQGICQEYIRKGWATLNHLIRDCQIDVFATTRVYGHPSVASFFVQVPIIIRMNHTPYQSVVIT